VLEHYTSIQGEGVRTGTPTQFVRFAGCNLRCPGWPCDTPQAIFPDQYRHEYEARQPHELALDIWTEYEATGARNICITGGEPFVQRELALELLLQQLIALHLSVEVFTNGTRIIPGPWLALAHITMDWKLPGSGEAQKEPEIRLINARKLKPTDVIKFVIANDDDLEEALAIDQRILSTHTMAKTWIGAAWGYPTDKLVEFITAHKLPWNLNVQTHKYIWSAEERYV